jgi:hypothetical protein
MSAAVNVRDVWAAVYAATLQHTLQNADILRACVVDAPNVATKVTQTEHRSRSNCKVQAVFHELEAAAR